VPGFEVYTWWGVFGPANMPAALVKRIYDEFAKAVKHRKSPTSCRPRASKCFGAPPEQLDAFRAQGNTSLGQSHQGQQDQVGRLIRADYGSRQSLAER
jgi:tripartite-type tricarboxylate transporter receptor subunit TctC